MIQIIAIILAFSVIASVWSFVGIVKLIKSGDKGPSVISGFVMSTALCMLLALSSLLVLVDMT